MGGSEIIDPEQAVRGFLLKYGRGLLEWCGKVDFLKGETMSETDKKNKELKISKEAKLSAMLACLAIIMFCLCLGLHIDFLVCATLFVSVAAIFLGLISLLNPNYSSKETRFL